MASAQPTLPRLLGAVILLATAFMIAAPHIPFGADPYDEGLIANGGALASTPCPRPCATAWCCPDIRQLCHDTALVHGVVSEISGSPGSVQFLVVVGAGARRA